MKRRTRRQIADSIGLAIALIGATAVAVAARRAEELRAPDAEAIYQVELASYGKALAAWQRDSAAVDSVSRGIDTDTLYRLHRAMLAAPDPAVVMQEIACEEWRLARRYQPLPSAAARKRMTDTVWRAEDAEALARLKAREPRVGHVQVGHWACGYPGEERIPPHVGGASMTTAAPRPVQPRPPRPSRR
jgi:hypothetical protein